MKRRVKRKIYLGLIIGGIVLFIGLIIFLFNFNFKFHNAKSIHEDALKYQTKACLAFYPNSENARKVAEDVCSKASEDSILDYALVPYGDYYLVQYADGTSYYVDRNYKELKIDSISDEGKVIISDYLRYAMKKDELDVAYTYDFLNETYYKNIDLSTCKYNVKGKNLLVYFEKYDYTLEIPLKYMQVPAGINLGYENELYIKPRYVSNNRKMICFTFDDGPDLSFNTSGQIVDKLYQFDSSATFFILGNRLGQKQINYCRQAVEKGMEYGSHTQSHANLATLSSSEIYNEIMIPYHDLCDNQYGFGYMMKVFRPPYGSHNQTVDSATNLTPVLWNVDSLDWKYRTMYDHDECVDVVCDKVIKETDENDVVLFHDIYQTSADAACRLVEYFIKQGYQIVSASELMDALNISNVSYFSGR